MIRRLSLFFLIICTGLTGFAVSPLSDSEADAIIAAEYDTKAVAREARRAKLNEATVKSEGSGVLPNGQAVIIREVEAPSANVEASLAEPAAPPVIAPTPEQLANWQSYNKKEHHTLMLSATVYDRSITKLRWTYELVDYVAFVNIDFNHLRSVNMVSSETDQYFCLMGIGDEPVSAIQEFPDLPAFSPNQTEYFVTEGNLENTAAFAGIETLLTHYDVNEAKLKTAHQRRVALNSARARYNAANPEPKEDFILQFWVPESSNGKAHSE